MSRSWSLPLLLFVAVAFLAVILTRTGADAAVRPPAGVVIGINANTQGYGESSTLIQGELRDARLRNIREDFEWRVVEPRRGAQRWARYDRLFADAARRGLRILPLLQGTPTWAGRTPETMPDDPRAFAAFAQRFATRYGPDGIFWRENPSVPYLPPTWFEIWNEPTNPVTVAGDVDPGRYARLYSAVVRRAAIYAPKARFLIYADGDVRVDGRWVPWIDALFDAVPSLAQDVQGIASHPYSADLSSYTRGRETEQFARVRTYKSRFAELGADVPLWVTEMGWSTCGKGRRCVSREKQASLVRELMLRLRTTYEDVVSAVYLYGYADAGANPRGVEDNFGLVTSHRRPKAGWRELVAILKRKPQS